jgi:uncharacterized protein
MTSESIAIGSRRVAPDVTRAVALIGVVTMNYHGTMNDVRVPHGFWEHLFHPYTGVLSTRFAATFVLMAGIGVALMASNTRTRAIPGEAGIRSRLARRGVLLYAAGLALNHAWAGTILFYYGAYLCIAAIIVHLASKYLVLIAGAAIVGGAALRGWLVSRPSAALPIEWLNPSPTCSDEHSPATRIRSCRGSRSSSPEFSSVAISIASNERRYESRCSPPHVP